MGDKDSFDLDEHYEDLSGLYNKKPFPKDFVYKMHNQPAKTQVDTSPKGDYFDYPEELRGDYYRNYRDMYSSQNREYWDWECIRRYATQIRTFYSTMKSILYDKYNAVDESAFPNWAKYTDIKDIDISEIAKNVTSAEQKLAEQFRTHSVKPYLNKNKTIARLLQYASEAWTTYHMLNGELPLIDISNFAKAYNEFKITTIKNDIDYITIYRGAKIVKREIDLYVKSDFITNNHPYCDLYANIDMKTQYNSILKSIGLITFEDCKNIEKDMLDALGDKRFTNTDIYEIISFYEDYDKIYKNVYDTHVVTKRILRLKKNYEGTNWSVPLFVYDARDNQNNEYDMYKKCETDLVRVEALLKNPYANNKIQIDINKLIKSLRSVINSAKDIHEESYDDSDLPDLCPKSINKI